MIFISCGTILIPFPRLIETCAAVFQDTQEEIHIQTGSTTLSHVNEKHFKFRKDFISNTQMINKLKQARLVICAAGEAGVYQALQNCTHKPVLFPRLKKFHEHVDDQQLEIARYFERRKLVYCALDTIQLANIVKKGKLERNTFLKEKANTQIIDRLIKFTEQIK